MGPCRAAASLNEGEMSAGDQGSIFPISASAGKLGGVAGLKEEIGEGIVVVGGLIEDISDSVDSVTEEAAVREPSDIDEAQGLPAAISVTSSPEDIAPISERADTFADVWSAEEESEAGQMISEDGDELSCNDSSRGYRPASEKKLI